MVVRVHEELPDGVERRRGFGGTGAGLCSGCKGRRALSECPQALGFLEQTLHKARVGCEVLFNESQRRLLLIGEQCDDAPEQPAGRLIRPRRTARRRRGGSPRPVAALHALADLALKFRQSAAAHRSRCAPRMDRASSRRPGAPSSHYGRHHTIVAPRQQAVRHARTAPATVSEYVWNQRRYAPCARHEPLREALEEAVQAYLLRASDTVLYSRPSVNYT